MLKRMTSIVFAIRMTHSRCRADATSFATYLAASPSQATVNETVRLTNLKNRRRVKDAQFFDKARHMPDLKWRIFILVLTLAGPAIAQDRGTLNPQPLPPLANPADPRTPAKELFGRARDAAPTDSEPIGFYSKGCLAGGVELPVNGPNWQVMRLSRNRNWGHPALIAFLERFSRRSRAASAAGRAFSSATCRSRVAARCWTGHASHQIGLDVDIWLTPMPPRELTRAEREEMSATDMVREDGLDVIPGLWTPSHLAVVRAAAEDPAVQRIFVNAAIKRAMCRVAAGEPWMRKVRPYYGHNYHFHVRLFCPKRLGELQGPGPDAARRRLRRLARLVVPRRGAAPQAVEQNLAADDDVRAAVGVPRGAERALGDASRCSRRAGLSRRCRETPRRRRRCSPQPGRRGKAARRPRASR